MKKIFLTQGKIALVDDQDYDWLSEHKWYAWKHRYTYYARRKETIDGKQKDVFMHREVLLLSRGDGKIVDHRNRNGLDNRHENLRLVNAIESNRNRGINKNNTSGYTGVGWCKTKRRWKAMVYVNYRAVYLGLYKSLGDAVEARRLGVKEHWTT